jgi:hypothetical protein
MPKHKLHAACKKARKLLKLSEQAGGNESEQRYIRSAVTELIEALEAE